MPAVGSDPQRVAAWEETFLRLPEGWTLLGPVWRPDDRLWIVSARRFGGESLCSGDVREAWGSSPVAALRALAEQFRREPGSPDSDGAGPSP